MTASASLAPRWPADATLLREVFRVARRKHWSRVFGDGSSDHLPEGVTVVAEWDQDGSLIELTAWPSGGYRLDVCGVVNMDVVSVEAAVDTLVAWSVLPARLSSARRSLRDRASDPAVVAAVATRLVGLLDRGVARSQAAGVIAAVLDALEVPSA